MTRSDATTAVDEVTGPFDLEATADPPLLKADDDLHLLVVGKTSVRPFPLTRGVTLIGRGEANELRIPDDLRVSRQHALLHVGHLAVEIEDCGSRNGTRVGSRKLRRGERTRVVPGDAIEVGETTFILKHSFGPPCDLNFSPHEAFARACDAACVKAQAEPCALVLIRFAGSPHLVRRVVAARIGGARAVICSAAPGCYDLLMLGIDAARAEQIAQELRTTLFAEGTVGVGVACGPRDGATPCALHARALATMQQAEELPASGAILHDDAMERLERTAARVAAGRINVLILGETGAGKEVLAQTIHRLSPRAKKPLLRLNCAALPEALLESELFGHERGAFTGAQHSKPGLLEMADGGTVFLDELGELRIATQAKLLRVLEDGQVLRIGALRPRLIDVRFVAATNRDLAADVARGVFRQDLLFRLAGATFVVPPLRDRPSEIEKLSHHFVEESARRARLLKPPLISADAMAWLRRYQWPGNIRELRNVIERALLLCDGQCITSEHLAGFQAVCAAASAHAGRPIAEPTSFSSRPTPQSLDESDDNVITDESPVAPESDSERRRIADALARCAGNQTRAACLLGISRKVLLARLDAYGVPRPRKR